ncbi:MAG: AI-2E family transporter [Acidimicrobiales bacterium]
MVEVPGGHEGDRRPAPPEAPRVAHEQVPWRTILAAIAAGAGAYVAFRLVVDLQRVLTWLVVAGFFAVVLNPLVDMLVHKAKLRRALAALIVFLFGLLTVAGLLYLIIQPIVTQVQHFVKDFPGLVQDAQNGKGTIGHLVQKYDLVNKAKQLEPKLQQALSHSGSQALKILRRVGSGAVSLLTILVLTYLLLVEGPRVLAGSLSLVRVDRQVRLRRIGNDSARAITGYMAGNVLISVIAAIVTYVGLWIFGVPFRGVAAVWVAFADLIPLIGATLGAVPTVGLAFLHSPAAGIGMIIIYVVYQQFENHVIQVAIMSRTVRLSPLTVLVALLAGVQLFGLLGALLAIPFAGIVQVVTKDVYQDWRGRREPPSSTGEEGSDAGAGPADSTEENMPVAPVEPLPGLGPVAHEDGDEAAEGA